MKKTKLNLLIFSLLVLIMGACGVKKTCTHDLFGGGFSGNKPVHGSSTKVAEELPELVTEKPVHVEREILFNRLHKSEKKQGKRTTLLQDMTALKAVNKTAKSGHSFKLNIGNKSSGNDKPKTLKQASRLYLVSSSIMSLGGLLILFSPITLLELGIAIILLGFILLCIAFIMALTGWLNKLKKNKSSQKITFGHVLLGLILLGLVTAIVVLSTSEGSGWYK
jgi:uncharacterized membrane protein YvlD (DUF360 family)